MTTRQVQYLVARGELRPVARGLVDPTSVERYVAARQGSRRRAWSEGAAWGAVAILSGQDARWMGPTQRSRLKRVLRDMSGGAELVSRTRDRACVRRYAGHPRSAERLRREIVDTSGAASALGLSGANRVDGYVAAADVEGIVARHALVDAADGQYALRSTSIELDVVRALADTDHVLGALDLAESLDPRERQAGLHALDAALRRHRG